MVSLNPVTNHPSAMPATKPKTRWLPFLGIAGLLATAFSGLGYLASQSLQNRVNVLANTPSWNTSFPSQMALVRLQGQVDYLGWHEQLSVNPPLPEQSYPIKKEQAENWITAHFGPDEQQAARSLVESTRHVTHTEFEAALSKSIGQFNDWLDQEQDKDYVLVVTDPRKSNHWVAELGLKYFKILPKQVLRIGFAGIGHLPDELVKFTEDNPKIKTFVFMDDAAYGCSQSKWQIGELSNIDLRQKCKLYLDCTPEKRVEIRKQEKPYRIKAIIPFMRNPDCVLPSSNVDISLTEPPLTDKHIQVFTSERMLTAKELLSTKDIEVLRELYRYPNDEHTLTYFDHKIADSLSTCSQIYRGKALERQPYQRENYPYYYKKVREEEMENSKLWNRLASWFNGPVDTRFIDPIFPPYHPEDWRKD